MEFDALGSVLANAAGGNDFDVVNLMISRGSEDYNYAMYCGLQKKDILILFGC